MADFIGEQLTYDPNTDPLLSRLEEIIKCLGYVLIKNLPSWFKILQNQINTTDPYDVKGTSFKDINAGQVLNSMMISSPIASNTTNTTELLNSEFDLVIASFYEACMSNNLLRSTAIKYKDPEVCMWELCHYFFIPVRLNYRTIPENIRKNSLRKWINVAFTIPFVANYRNKYINVVNNLTFIQLVQDAFVDNPQKMQNVVQNDYKKIESCLGRRYSENSQLHKFVRACMNIMLFACAEMIKSYNPCLSECMQINAKFNGEWCNRFDPMLSTQLSKLDEAVNNTTSMDLTQKQ